MRFWNGVEQKAQEMADDSRRLAMTALANGGHETSRAVYYEGGPVVVTVAFADGWWPQNTRRSVTYHFYAAA